jgi:DNA mismatch repair protein MutS
MSFNIDNDTLHDLSIFNGDLEQSIFERFNFTQTHGGSQHLQSIFRNPTNHILELQNRQHIIHCFQKTTDIWPTQIGEGAIIVMERFFKDAYPGYGPNDKMVSRLLFSIIEPEAYGLLKFSIKIFLDFFQGIYKIHQALSTCDLKSYQHYIKTLNDTLQIKPIAELITINQDHVFSTKEYMYFGYHLRIYYKKEVLKLINLFHEFEAWYALAKAMQQYKLNFPKFIVSQDSSLTCNGLVHLMFDTKQEGYKIHLNKEKGLLFLTGCNMSGKSTLIKSIGVSVFLAHLGVGVPAQTMTLSVFDGICTHLNVNDNLNKGQSYFYSEVKKIKEVAEKVNTQQHWLILIDEIFKGTNVIDAMKCASAVINNFSRIKKSLLLFLRIYTRLKTK